MYTVIQNFKAGLDTRRSELSSVPGSLEQLIDCHINQGGEIEKRKAFVRTPIPSGTFGLVSLSDGLYAFGSADLASQFPVPLPNGGQVKYQRLQSPTGANMTRSVFAVTFGGHAFVIAEYDDGLIIPFYDGAVVTDFITGKVLPYQNTNTKLATNLRAAFAQGGVFTVADGTVSSAFKAIGPVGSEYNWNISKVSAAGDLTVTKTNAGSAAVPATRASASFRVITLLAASVEPNPTITISVGPNLGAMVVVLNALALPWYTDQAVVICQAINSDVSGYYAQPGPNNTVTIYAPVGSPYNNYILKVDSNSALCEDFYILLSGFTFTAINILEDGVVIASWSGAAGTKYIVINTALAAALNATGRYNATASGSDPWFLLLSRNSVYSGLSPVEITTTFSAGNPSDSVSSGSITTPLGVTLSTTNLGYARNGVHVFLTDICYTSVSGGSSPYYYSWEYVLGDTTIYPGATNLSSIQFAAPDNGSNRVATWRCRVSDAAGHVVYSANLVVTI